MEVRGWGLLGSLLVTAGRSPPPLALQGAESPQPPALSGMAKAPCPPQSGLRSMTRSQGGTKTWHSHPESGLVCGAVPASRLLGFGPRPAWTPCHSPASPAAAPARALPRPPRLQAGTQVQAAPALLRRPGLPPEPWRLALCPSPPVPCPRSSVSLPQGSPLGFPTRSQGLAVIGCRRLRRPPHGAHLSGCSRVDHCVYLVIA